MVDGGATPEEDTLMIAVSRLFLDNIDHIQSSWVKFGNERGLELLNAGADDFMGTILSEEITKRAGGGHGEFRSFAELVDLIESIDRVPVERSTDYDIRRRIDSANGRPGPALGPHADFTPLLRGERRKETDSTALSD
jgi:FO synthase subunit 2